MMSNDQIDYAKLLDNAMRSVLRQALDCAVDGEFPGSHHLYITFGTQRPGVKISAVLLAQYPQEMTIVLENKFWDLTTTENAFSVTLSFNGKSQKLFIPFDAVKAFVDPSVNFGLQFDNDGNFTPIQTENETKEKISDKTGSIENSDIPTETQIDDTVIALDSFRKK
ncbi:MAG: hypothetical protein CMM37_06145 [Rhodospirillaceae bacterium]|nr:hypothetical protein [Rhodospirillaceae bacterium]